MGECMSGLAIAIGIASVVFVLLAVFFFGMLYGLNYLYPKDDYDGKL